MTDKRERARTCGHTDAEHDDGIRNEYCPLDIDTQEDMNMTGRQRLAERFGLKSFDLALPDDWCEAAHKRIGEWPSEYAIVWSYDPCGYWTELYGYPVALDARAARLLRRLQLS